MKTEFVGAFYVICWGMCQFLMLQVSGERLDSVGLSLMIYAKGWPLYLYRDAVHLTCLPIHIPKRRQRELTRINRV